MERIQFFIECEDHYFRKVYIIFIKNDESL